MLPNLPPPPGTIAREGANAGGQLQKAIRHDDSQQSVIDCHDKNIVAEAFAGAGKTTTAIGYAAARPKSRILYLCLNRANQIDAAGRFGKNVEARTGHSMAYQVIGHKFKTQLAKNWSVRDIMRESSMVDPRMAAALQSTLSGYFCSADKDLGVQHVMAVADDWDLAPHEVNQVVDLSRVHWAKMKRPGSGVTVTHDTYLKLWALSAPALTQYDHIILDEAQDTNPVTASIINGQRHANKLLIGDRHQSIYLFRGSLNAMEAFAAGGATVLKMPRTWRFGPEIAAHANKLLSHFKDEQTAIIGAGPSREKVSGGSRAVLARTNAGLYAEAAACMGRGVHWIGGIEGYKVDTLLDVYFLKANRRSEIRDSTMRSYLSWSNFQDEVKATRNPESRMLMKLVDEYGKDTPLIVSQFKKNALPTESGARLVLGTGHKAKGLDFDHVKLGDDFTAIDDAISEMTTNPMAGLTPKTAQEINLIYVGLTRARHRVELNKPIQQFMNGFDAHKSTLQEMRGAHKQAMCAEPSDESAPAP